MRSSWKESGHTLPHALELFRLEVFLQRLQPQLVTHPKVSEAHTV
jgi:hypothetical protein